jgi:hypothetical protein
LAGKTAPLWCIIFLIVAQSGVAWASDGFRLLSLDGRLVKWGSPVLGSGAVVTYAVVTARVAFPGARNCDAIVPLDALEATSGVTSARFDAELSAAFVAWSRTTNIAFRSAPAEGADILIGAEARPRGRAFTNVDRSESPEGTVASIRRSVICLNPTVMWKTTFDGNLNVYDLRYTLEHEIGHAIGLDHPGVAGVLMDFRYTESFRDLQPADIAGANALYGGPMVAGETLVPAAPDDASNTSTLGLGVK